MEITIENFRCHTAKTIVLQAGATLLTGVNGAGKSTLFAAIAWGLYGNVRSIAPNTADNAHVRTVVRLRWMQTIGGQQLEWQITRYTNSGLLQVIACQPGTSVQVYSAENTVAQEHINRLFGEADVWGAACYIRQKSWCALLTGTQKSRMKLLNALGFLTQSPEEYLGKLDLQIKRVTGLVSQLNAGYDTEMRCWQRAIVEAEAAMPGISAMQTMDDGATTFIYQLTAQQVGDLGHAIVVGGVRLAELQKQQVDFNRIFGAKQALQAQLVGSQQIVANLKTQLNAAMQEAGKTTTTADVLHALEAKLANVTAKIRVGKQDVQRMEQWTRLTAARDNAQQRWLQCLSTGTTEEQVAEMVDKLAEVVGAEQRYQLSRQAAANLGVASAMEVVAEIQVLEAKAVQLETALAEWNKQAAIAQRQVQIRQQQQQAHAQWVNAKQQQQRLVEQEHQVEVELAACPAGEPAEIRAGMQALEREHVALVSRQNNLLATRNILECPQCACAIRMIDGKLVTAECLPAKPADIEAGSREIALVLEKRKKAEAQLAGIMRRETLATSLASVKQLLAGSSELGVEPVVDIGNVIVGPMPTSSSALRTRIMQLQQLVWPEPPVVNSVSLTIYQGYQQAKNALEQWMMSNKPVDTDMGWQPQAPLSTEQLTALTHEEQRVADLITRIRQVEANISSAVAGEQRLLAEIAALPVIADVSTDIRQLDTEVKQAQQGLARHSALTKILEWQSRLTTEYTRITTVTQELASLGLLKQAALDAQIEQLEACVTAINLVLADVCSRMFDRDIAVIFSLSKRLKTTQEVRQKVNLTIRYKGANYEDLAALSGGEADRISCAMLIALATMSPSPIILLDEAWASLNEESRVSCLNVVKDMLGSRIVCVVNHEDIPGFYDTVLAI